MFYIFQSILAGSMNLRNTSQDIGILNSFLSLFGNILASVKIFLIFSAVRICPSCPSYFCNSCIIGIYSRIPCKPSIVIEAAMSRCFDKFIASYRTWAPTENQNCIPLVKAKPSFEDKDGKIEFPLFPWLFSINNSPS